MSDHRSSHIKKDIGYRQRFAAYWRDPVPKQRFSGSYWQATGHQVILFFLLSSIFSTSVADIKHNRIITEVYGTDQVTADRVLKRYGHDLKKYGDLKEKSDGNSDNTALNKTFLMEEKLKKELMRGEKFGYVQPSLVRYRDNQTAYLTIDVVDKKDKQRLSHFLPRPTGNSPDPDHLIRDWTKYENTAIKIENTGRLQRPDHCPVWHCIWGYDHPALKNYGEHFTTVVPKNQTKLLNVLRYDRSPPKRAAAAYLLAHLKDGQVLVKILSPFMFDPDAMVRNNVMRVIAMTAEKIPLNDFSISQAILASTLPATTDRNKSLYIILALLNNPKNIRPVQQKMTVDLLNMLKMQQPIVHRPAWEILKKISGRRYGERDYHAFETWAANRSRQAT